MYRSYSKGAFTKALQELIPEIQKRDLVKGGAGVRGWGGRTNAAPNDPEDAALPKTAVSGGRVSVARREEC